MVRHLSVDEKLAIVQKYYHAGSKQKTIARELHCTQQEVSLVLRQFVERGNCERQKRSGRPSVMTEEVKRSVERGIKRKRTASGAELTERVARETGRRVSQRTIQTIRRRLGYHPVHVSVKPALMDTHRAARLAFCREHQRDAISLWGFMDEAGVTIDYHRQIHWIKQGECRPVRESPPARVRSNIWAAVWWSGKTDIFITTENFNSAKYLEALEANLAPKLPLDRKRFVQDGVPFHWTIAVRNWLRSHRVRLVDDFPAKSPDLNAIEYIWAWMKHIVAARQPHDRATLEAAIREAWDSLTQTTIRHFIKHVNTVMKEIIMANGGHSH